MQQILRILIASLAIVLCGSAYAADIRIGSWNVKRLGHGDQHSYQALGAIASKFDLVALQEVMTMQGLDKLEAAIEKASGESWGRLESHLIGSRSYKEMYAFLYRESKVSYDEGAVVYLDRGNKFIREPFSAKFKTMTGTSFAVGTVHILYGKGIEDRTPEIKALAEYWTWMRDVYPGTELILLGDFNLPPSHPAWEPLKQHAKPLITQGATTLSSVDGRFANLYDNVWISRSSRLPIANAGIVDFPRLIGWSHEKSRKHVSDHTPVYMTLGQRQLVGTQHQVAPTTPARSLPESTPNVRPAMPVQAQKVKVRGNMNSKIFHKPHCPSYEQIAQKNRIEFDSPAAAQAAGYRPAGNCS